MKSEIFVYLRQRTEHHSSKKLLMNKFSSQKAFQSLVFQHKRLYSKKFTNLIKPRLSHIFKTSVIHFK